MSDNAVRLNKFLASCGIGSRRHCDALVQDGQVTVNGEPCTKPATRIGPEGRDGSVSHPRAPEGRSADSDRLPPASGASSASWRRHISA